MTTRASDQEWETTTAADVTVGDQVRLRDLELTVSRIESSFLGRTDMLAFIEDTEQRWLKAPTPPSAEVQVRRAR